MIVIVLQRKELKNRYVTQLVIQSLTHQRKLSKKMLLYFTSIKRMLLHARNCLEQSVNSVQNRCLKQTKRSSRGQPRKAWILRGIHTNSFVQTYILTTGRQQRAIQSMIYTLLRIAVVLILEQRKYLASHPMQKGILFAHYTCPARTRANASIATNNPTWRYRFFGVFPNINMSSEGGSQAAFAKDPINGLAIYDGGWPSYNPAKVSLIRFVYDNLAGTNLGFPLLYDACCADASLLTLITSVLGVQLAAVRRNYL